MTDEVKVTMAFDILDGADVMQEFDDSVWIKVDKELWEAFTAPPAVQSGPARDCGTPMLLESMEYFGKLSKDAKC